MGAKKRHPKKKIITGEVQPPVRETKKNAPIGGVVELLKIIRNGGLLEELGLKEGAGAVTDEIHGCPLTGPETTRHKKSKMLLLMTG